MARVIYSGIMSLDGYINDAGGNFDWSMPDAEVHGFVNDRERTIGTRLMGRRVYEVMSAWDDPEFSVGEPDVIRDFQDLWLDSDKIVFTRTLESLSASRTRIEPTVDLAAIERLKATADRDVSVGGANLGAQLVRAGLVDEFQLYLNPVIVGGGTRFLPDGVRLDLELVEEHRFRNGVTYLAYRPRTAAGQPGGGATAQPPTSQ